MRRYEKMGNHLRIKPVIVSMLFRHFFLSLAFHSGKFCATMLFWCLV